MTLAEKIAARKALGMTSAEYNAHLEEQAKPKLSEQEEFLMRAMRTDNLGMVKSALDMMSKHPTK